MRKILLTLLSISIIFITAHSEPGASAYEGTRFLVGFMQNELLYYPDNGLSQKLYITSKVLTAVSIYQTYYLPKYYILNPDSVLVVDVDPALQVKYSEVPLLQAIEIVSDLPITVSGFSSRAATSDSYLALPVSSWGNEYVALSYPNDQYDWDDATDSLSNEYRVKPRSSEFMVIASEDNTIIKFKPKALTWNAKQVYNEYSVLLNRNECYLVKSAATQRGTGDLTGTIVKSNKPVGFLSGHVRTAIPQFLNSDWTSKNHLIEMLQPVSSWGRKFVTIPFFAPPFTFHGDLIRVTNYYPNTYVSYKTETTYHSYFMKDSGSFLNIPYLFENAIWTSTKPVQIGQYMMKSGKNDNFGYDPTLVTIPPVEQFINRAVFYVPSNIINNRSQFNNNFILLLAEDSTLNNLTLDGKFLFIESPELNLQNISGTNYHWARVKVEPGTHQLLCSNGKFNAILYGVGEYDSYSQVVGSLLANPFTNDTIPPYISLIFDCGKLDGYAFEQVTGKNSGIEYIQVIEDSTYNFKWTISTKTDTTTCITFHAEPQDVSRDGKIVLEIRDRNGNGSRYRYFFNKLQLIAPGLFDMGEVHSHDTVCRDFNIINYGKDTILVSDSYLLKKDLRIRYVLNTILPCKLYPNDTISGRICFDPRGDTLPMDNQLVIVYGCNLDSRILLKATLKKYELDAMGFDFGQIRIADSACSTVFINNPGLNDVIIVGLNSIDGKIFLFDTVGVFPKTLKPGDTLFIKVCFSPDDTLDYELNPVCINNESIPLTLKVSGSGGKPNINSFNVNWGKRRIGTSNDTSIVIFNNGNFKAQVFFSDEFGDSNVIMTQDILNLNNTMNPGDSIRINLGFNPVYAQFYNVKGYLKTDWKLHSPLEFNLFGEGIIPEIRTFNVDFGKIHIFDQKDTTTSIIKSTGSEILTIDKIVLISGDTNSFKIDLTKFQNIQIPVDSSVISSIIFKPQKVGYHEVTLEVTHDANPNYERSVSLIKLFGRALPEDTILFNQSLIGTKLINSCNIDTLDYSISNSGNVDINITALNLNLQNISAAKWLNSFNFPIPIRTKSSYTNKIFIAAENDGPASLSVTAVLNDTLNDMIKHDLNIKKSKIDIGTIPGFKAAPGDTAILTLRGVFIYKIVRPIRLNLELTTSMKNYKVLSPICNLNLTGTNYSKVVICKITQNINGFEIIPVENIDVPVDNLNWEVELPLFVFLNDEKYPEIGLKIFSDDCFYENSVKILTEISEVCVFNIRSIIMSRNSLKAELKPNPADNYLQLDFEIDKDIELEINIFDNSGKKSYFSEKLNLKKGIYSRIFETSPLTNGMYFMNLKTSGITKNLIFIIKK